MRKRKIIDDDIAQAWFEALLAKNEGRISPRILLDAAKDPSAPVHDRFIWDDEIAGEQYRLAQAGQMIRMWRGSVLRIDAEAKLIRVETVRRAQSPFSQRGKDKASYSSVEDIMADPIMREEMLQTVLRELAAYRKRYSQLLALADIWRAIDEALDMHAAEQPKARPGDDEQPTA